MRVSVILGLGLALTASSVLAQQTKAYAPKKTYLGNKDAASVPPVTTPAATSPRVARELRSIEKQSAKTPTNMKVSGSKPRSGSARLLQSTPNPPIKATSGGGMGVGTKGSSTANQGKNPYHGRLRQKSR